MKPIVAIIGRPNVGKSTFFNRITRTQNALVDDVPGVTRDRNYGDVHWDDIDFTLVDTGGFLQQDEDDFAHLIRAQINQAVEDADVVVLLMDGKSGVSPFDTDLIQLLRDVSKPAFYVVNKIDGIEKEMNLYDFYRLGIEKLYPVSASHGYGVSDFLDDLVGELSRFTSGSPPDNDRDLIKIAVVGRPNVGKSSLINRILGEDRLLVSDIPGTTRDAIDTICKINGKSYLMIDTAGIRRKGRVSKRLEKFSVIKALRSLERCDVALILLDTSEGITEQDIKVAGYAHDRGCGCILLLNKWDLIEKDGKTVNRYYEALGSAAKFLSFAPVLTISALTGQRVLKIFEFVNEVFNQYGMRIGTGELNRIVDQAVKKTMPPHYRGRRLKFYYTTQVSTKPPTFVCFVNYPEAIHFSYKRYLVNQLRSEAHFDKTPVRMFFRKRTGREK